MNKTALVTGGSHNIGRGIAIALAQHGYDVAITYNKRVDDARNTQDEIEKLGQKCFVYQASLENAEVPQQIVDQAHQDLGHLDLMVCNAANGGVRDSILTVTAQRLDDIYALNYRNYILCAGAAARHMVADKIPGSILFITSTRAARAYPDDFLYGGLKSAIERASRSMALDLASYGIRVNCIAPGAIWPVPAGFKPPVFISESVPLKRVGTPDEIGEVAVFLASDAASYITGTTIRQDGGLILPGMMECENPTIWISEKWHKYQYETAMKMMEKESI